MRFFKIKMTNVIICHGLGANSADNWFPLLKGELESLGCRVTVPDFPGSDKPKLGEWLAELRKYDKQTGKNTILIGHSLGCPFLLNFLELRHEPVKAVFLVAGFAGLLKNREINALVAGFSDRKFDWKKIKSMGNKFYVVNSDDDYHIPVETARQLALNLKTEAIFVKGRGHITDAAFPELLKMIKKEL